MPQLTKLSAAASLLATFNGATAQTNYTTGSNYTAGPAWDTSAYATSPPVYPSPNSTGLGWEDAFARASEWVSQLTLEEKARLLTGTPGPCVGNIAPIERLGFKGLCLQDGPLGIRAVDYASVFPAGLTVAASFDKDLAHARGQDIGAEFMGKGANVGLGPVAGPLGRNGYGGRNWEGFSPDPYLTGHLFAETIVGMEESGTQACAKHFIGNEQETQRNPSGFLGAANPSNFTAESVSTNIDDRTMHELYLWPFANGVKAGVSSVMCSYNRVNGSYACQNSKVQNGLLKGELGFQGYVMSDWGAVHAGVDAIDAGLDMNMPGGINWPGSLGDFYNDNTSYFGANLTKGVNNGTIDIERVDDMARRIMTPYFRLGQDSQSFPDADPSGVANGFFPPANYHYNWTYNTSLPVDVRTDEHSQLIRELGAAGIVMLKNVNNTLPLKAPKNIGVYGNDAGEIVTGLYSNAGVSLGPEGYEYGVLAVGGGSGTARLTYVVTPLEAIKARAKEDGALVQYVLNNTQIAAGDSIAPTSPEPEVCLVFLKTWATEGQDRESLLVDFNGTAVVETVAENCANTVVIVNNAGLNVMPFADHPNVTAILAAHLGGQEAGNSIVDVLYGKVNPSGKLPYTMPLKESDFDFAMITNSTELVYTHNATAWQANLKEGLLTDYRHFDYYNLSVAYEFGFGLSYTTFDLSDVSIKANSGNVSAETPAKAIVPGGNPALWETLYTVSAKVSNTGSVTGSAVPQLYLGLPQPADDSMPTPVKVLRGFEKIKLEAGESQTVEFPLMRRDLSYWSVIRQDWVIAEGEVNVMAGFSSRDIKEKKAFSPLKGI